MIQAESPRADRFGRSALLAAIAVLHLVLIAFLIRAVQAPRSTPASALKLVALGVAPAPAPAPEKQAVEQARRTPPLPSPPSPGPRQAAGVLTEGTASALQVDALGLSGGGCDIASTIAQSIQSDAPAMAELTALPPDARTKADAVLLWDGDWMAQVQAAPDAPHRPLRQAVERAVARTPPDCLGQVQTGPRFIPVGLQSVTVMLVIGSGQWQWTDLLLSEAFPIGACPGDLFSPCGEEPGGSFLAPLQKS